MTRQRFYTHAAIVVVATVLGGIGGLVLASTSSKTYTARADVLVVPSVGIVIRDPNNSADYTQQQAANFAQLANREFVLSSVVSSLHLDTTVDDLAGHVRATVPLDTALVSISVSESSAAQAAAIANSIVTNLSKVVEQVAPPPPYPKSVSPITLQTVQSATPPQDPSSPKPLLDLLVGLVIGLCLGVGVIAARDALPEPATPRQRPARPRQRPATKSR